MKNELVMRFQKCYSELTFAKKQIIYVMVSELAENKLDYYISDIVNQNRTKMSEIQLIENSYDIFYQKMKSGEISENEKPVFEETIRKFRTRNTKKTKYQSIILEALGLKGYEMQQIIRQSVDVSTLFSLLGSKEKNAVFRTMILLQNEDVLEECADIVASREYDE